MTSLDVLLSDTDRTRGHREELYRWFHRHPELSMQETETPERIVHEVASYGYHVERIGGGVVATLENGPGPTIMVRADFDGLPLLEDTGLDYASTVTRIDHATGQEVPVMHGCGHDFHTASLLGAAHAFAQHRDAWRGTFIALFQPGEELALGARSMVADGLVDRVKKPDVVLAQHVMAYPAGHVLVKTGPMLSSSFSVEITVPGKGTHGSMPEKGIDPVVLGSSIVMQLQTVVSRMTALMEPALLTVGSFHSGTAANIISDHATLQVNTRSYTQSEAALLRSAIERIVRAACQGVGLDREPEFRYYAEYPLTVNDPAATAVIHQAFTDFYEDRVSVADHPQSASEDFSEIPRAFGVPYCYWMFGGFSDMSQAVGNHSPQFAPDLQPTLDTGTENIIVGASAWLATP